MWPLVSLPCSKERPYIDEYMGSTNWHDELKIKKKIIGEYWRWWGEVNGIKYIAQNFQRTNKKETCNKKIYDNLKKVTLL